METYIGGLLLNLYGLDSVQAGKPNVVIFLLHGQPGVAPSRTQSPSMGIRTQVSQPSSIRSYEGAKPVGVSHASKSAARKIVTFLASIAVAGGSAMISPMIGFAGRSFLKISHFLNGLMHWKSCATTRWQADRVPFEPALGGLGGYAVYIGLVEMMYIGLNHDKMTSDRKPPPPDTLTKLMQQNSQPRISKLSSSMPETIPRADKTMSREPTTTLGFTPSMPLIISNSADYQPPGITYGMEFMKNYIFPSFTSLRNVESATASIQEQAIRTLCSQPHIVSSLCIGRPVNHQSYRRYHHFGSYYRCSKPHFILPSIAGRFENKDVLGKLIVEFTISDPWGFKSIVRAHGHFVKCHDRSNEDVVSLDWCIIENVKTSEKTLIHPQQFGMD